MHPNPHTAYTSQKDLERIQLQEREMVRYKRNKPWASPVKVYFDPKIIRKVWKGPSKKDSDSSMGEVSEGRDQSPPKPDSDST